MSNSKLGFKLWFRKSKEYISQNFLSLLTGMAPVTLSILGIVLAVNGNEIAKSSYELAKNDTSQQAQINRLNAIVSKLDSQLQITLEYKRLDRKAGFNRLKKAMTDISGMRGFAILDQCSIAEKINFLRQPKPLLENELNNPYLLSNDSLFDYWTRMYSFTLMTIGFIDRGGTVTVLNGKKLNGAELEKHLNSNFQEMFSNNYSKFLHFMLKQTRVFW